MGRVLEWGRGRMRGREGGEVEGEVEGEGCGGEGEREGKDG